jgi:phage-related minor tail protein
VAAPLDAKIRISALVDQAVRALRQVRQAYTEIGQEAGAAAAAGTSGASEAAAAAKAEAAQVLAAKKAQRAAEVAIERQRRQAERQAQLDAREAVRAQKAADAEALANKRAAAAAQRKADAEAAAEALRAKRAAAAAQKKIDDEAAKAKRQADNQARQLAPQITDIVVGAATGQSPFTLLLQQGGQLKDLFGGVGNAGRALLSVFSLMRVLAAGVALAIAAIALAATDGYRESDQLRKSLAATGNTAGLTLGVINGLAREIADSQNAAIGGVRETLAALVATGPATTNVLRSQAAAVTALRKLTGASAEEAIKAFADQADGITDWASKSNRAYNFLTAEQIKYIRSLESQGRVNEAVTFTNNELAASLKQRTEPALGTIEKLWKGITKAASEYWDVLKGLGRDDTPDQEVNRLRKRLQDLRDARDGAARGGKRKSTTDAEIAEVEALLQARERQFNSDMVRGAERAAERELERQKEYEQSKEFVDALIALDGAKNQRQAALDQAALDQRQARAERQNARGLLSEQQFNTELAAINAARLRSQAAAVEAQIALESRRVTKTPIDVKGKETAIAQLEAQLAGVRAAIGKAESDALSSQAAAALAKSREDAQAWAEIWQRSADAITDYSAQLAARAAEEISDPLRRAKVEADVAVAEMRRRLAGLDRDLRLRISLTGDPQDRASLEAQLTELREKGSRAIEGAASKVNFESLSRGFEALTARASQLETDLAAQVERGALTTEQAEARKLEARRRALPELQRIFDALELIAKSPAEVDALARLKAQLDGIRDVRTEFQQTVSSAIGSSATAELDAFTSGTKKAGEAFRDFLGGVARAALNLINKRIGESLAESLLPKSGGTGWLSTAAQFIGSFFHSGGVVGSGGARRSVSPLAFMGAPRYHSGGIAGLRSNEMAAVLQYGEEVLTRDDPRHVRNGGRGGNQVSVAVTVNGATGSQAERESAGAELGGLIANAVDSAIEVWAARESRVGGRLAPSRA